LSSAVVIIGSLKDASWTDQDDKKHFGQDLMVRAIGEALGHRRSKPKPKEPEKRPESKEDYYPPPPEDEIPF